MVQVAHPVDIRTQLETALTQQHLAPFSNNSVLSNRPPSRVLPPAYPTAPPVPNSVSAPAYTSQPSPTERVISRTDSRPSSEPRLDPRPLPDSYIYKTSRLVLDLGRRVWPSRWPVYGANGVVAGKIIVRKADHAVDLCVTLEGLCVTTLVERGMPIAQFQTTLTCQTLKLWSSGTGGLPCPSYDFSFPLPTYAQGSMELLPPTTFHSLLMRGYVEVKYSVRVDMTRTRFHRHETAMTKIHYLPRSYPPPIDLLGQELDVMSAMDDDIWQTIKLTSTKGNLKATPAPSADERVTVELSLLKRQVYTACTPIPFRLTIQSSSPALALLPHVTVQLVKRWILVAGSVNVRIARESVLGSGEVWRVEEADEGNGCTKVVNGAIVGGRAEAEVSYRIDGVFKVDYLVRVCIKPPQDMRVLGDSLPTFFHQEVIRMATHEYTTDDLVRGHPSLPLAPRCIW